jgi:hypothetical protein
VKGKLETSGVMDLAKAVIATGFLRDMETDLGKLKVMLDQR